MIPAFNLKDLWQILCFIGIQYSLGRRGSYPFGILQDFSLFKITAIVVICDMLQTVLLLNLLVYSHKKFKWLKRLKKNKAELDDKPGINKTSVQRPSKLKKVLTWLEKRGAPGLVFIAALPYGGGALTGSIVAVSIKMDKKKAFILITTGCIIGSLLYYLGFAGILSISS